MDQYDVYNTRDMKQYYNKWENDSVAKKYWTQIIQFRTENPEETGHTLNGKDVIDEGNWKKDLLYLWITGVNKISAWKTDMESCLTSTYVAVLEIGDGKADQDTDYTRCVAESQILW